MEYSDTEDDIGDQGDKSERNRRDDKNKNSRLIWFDIIQCKI